MSAVLLAALLAQAVSLVLLRHQVGRRWLLRPVVLFMLASTVDLGIAPALLAIPSVSAQDRFAIGVKRSFTDQADLIMSVVMLAFTVAYLLTHPERVDVDGPSPPVNLAALTRVLDFRVLAAACVPMAVVTAAGRGYNDGSARGAGTPLETNLVSTFFIVIIAAAAVALVLRHGTRWFLPALIAQSLLLALAGERTPILMDGLALIIVLTFAGIRLRRRQLLAVALLAVVAMLAINGVRAQQGRGIFYANSGLGSRVSALGGGLSGGASVSDPPMPGLVAQFASREAGVDFAGAILQSMSGGQPRLDAGYVPESLLLAVPSFLWNSKLALGTGINPAQLQIDDFGLQQINYIPSMVGTYIGMLSFPWLLLLFFFLGLVFGRFERWLLRECTPARVILLAGAIASALLYEAGLPTIMVQMRAAAALALVAKCAELLLYGPRPQRTAFAGPSRSNPDSPELAPNLIRPR
ncbi:MAG TPA: hypothetical protein VHZ03_19635 [Trebonia sp.]|nr:hypothetical protein [Trebonia sp.]